MVAGVLGGAVVLEVLVSLVPAGILGAVALTLAYYLLRVSTINTIKENVWEYGQIRAIGLRKGQATRIYLYEQYAVILTAIILGLLGGLLRRHRDVRRPARLDALLYLAVVLGPLLLEQLGGQLSFLLRLISLMTTFKLTRRNRQGRIP